MSITTEAPAVMALQVVRRVRESRHVVSLHLRPAPGSVLHPFVAGQHLPLRLGLPQRPVATYTISSSPLDRDGYRISVKLEPGGKGGSRYLHEAAQIGETLQAAAPRGSFVLDQTAPAIVLLTGGIGITPALSMLHALAAGPARPVYFLHACNDASEHAFAAEIAALAADKPWIHVHTAYARATPDDLKAGDARAGAGTRIGLLDRAALRTLLPLDDYRVYLCGPDGFMRAMRAALIGLGMPDAHIRQEVFAPAPQTRPDAAMMQIPDPIPGPVSVNRDADPAAARVGFARSGRQAAWTGASDTLLDFAEEAGLEPPFSCRAGICGTCACRLLQGDVDWIAEPLDSPQDGEILLCCVRPRGDVVLDL